MSYILNALRKSEQERQTRQSQNIENSILEQPETVNHRSRWPIIISVLVAINLVILVYLITSNQLDLLKPNKIAKTLTPSLASSETKIVDDKIKLKPPAITKTVDSHQPPPKVTKPITVTEKKALPATEKIKPETPKTKPTKTPKKTLTVATNSQQKRVTTLKPVPAPPSLAPPIQSRTDIATKTPEQPEVINTHKESFVNDDLAVKKETLKKAETPPQPSPVIAKKATPEHPWLKELPYEFRRKVPKLNINVFVYNENPEQGFVIIDMVKYQVNQDLPDNMILKAIQNDSLVVDYKNRTFRIKRP